MHSILDQHPYMNSNLDKTKSQDKAMFKSSTGKLMPLHIDFMHSNINEVLYETSRKHHHTLIRSITYKVSTYGPRLHAFNYTMRSAICASISTHRFTMHLRPFPRFRSSARSSVSAFVYFSSASLYYF